MYRWLREMDKLLVLRGLAALTVVAYHTQNYIFPELVNKLQFAGHNFSWVILANGKMAVVVFFALSGYLMFKGYLSGRYQLSLRGSVEFLRSRARRIMPLYFFLIVLFIFFAHPQLLVPKGLPILWQLLTFTYDGNSGFVTAFWSISTEMQFYLLMPILAFLFIRLLPSGRGKAAMLAGIVTISIFIRHQLHIDIGPTPNVIAPLVIFFDAFLIGGGAAMVMHHHRARLRSLFPQSLWLTTALLIGCTVLPLSSLYWQRFGSYGYHTIGVTLISLITALFIIAAELSTTKSFEKKHYSLSAVIMRPSLFPEFMGAISYGIYLWHSVIIERLWYFPVDPLSVRQNMARIVLVAVVSSVFAYMTYKYVEGRKPAYDFSERSLQITRLYSRRLRAAAKRAIPARARVSATETPIPEES